jgi:hypothetical protein
MVKTNVPSLHLNKHKMKRKINSNVNRRVDKKEMAELENSHHLIFPGNWFQDLLQVLEFNDGEALQKVVQRLHVTCVHSTLCVPTALPYL